MSEDNLNRFVFTAKYKETQKTFSNKPLNVLGDYECPHCKEKITKEQVLNSYKHMWGDPNKKKYKRMLSKFNQIADDVVKYLNEYREHYNINTCLRKAQFIAQVATETKYLTALDESMYYQCHKITNKFSGEDISLSPSNLEKHSDILEIIDENEYEEGKEPENYSNYSINAAYIYGYAKKEYKLNLSEDKKIKVKVKKHNPDEKEVASRFYHSRFGNGDKFSYDGYRFRGRGLLHLTWKSNYQSFAKKYEQEDFSDKSDKLKGESKIIEDTDQTNIKGNYDLLSEPIYAVQSGVWYWSKGRSYKSKRPYDYADLDSVVNVSFCVNGGMNGIDIRKKVLPKAREAFKVYDHYQKVYDNGSFEQKGNVKENLEKISFDHTEKAYKYTESVSGDEKALKILKKISTTTVNENTNE